MSGAVPSNTGEDGGGKVKLDARGKKALEILAKNAKTNKTNARQRATTQKAADALRGRVRGKATGKRGK